MMVSGQPKLRKDWLAPLIHSQMSTGNFAKMAKDAIRKAEIDRRWDDAALYKNLLGQIADYYSQIRSEDL